VQVHTFRLPVEAGAGYSDAGLGAFGWIPGTTILRELLGVMEVPKMTVHLYYSLIPEALIASMLTPEQFGQYYATGHKYKSKGPAMFFEVDPSYRHEYFAIDEAFARCVPKADGSPKNSVYISMYRVQEHLPVSALGQLYLTAEKGDTVALSRADTIPTPAPGLHLYQNLAPVNSLVVSHQGPEAYWADVTVKSSNLFRFPGLCFVELELGNLAHDPESGRDDDLPYPFMQHLREALAEVMPGGKRTKLVQRVHSLVFLYRMVKGGFYVGVGDAFSYYPVPSHDALSEDRWWRLANS
jgi:hypothetical protein